MTTYTFSHKLHFTASSPTFSKDSQLLEDAARRDYNANITRIAPAIFAADGVWFYCSDAVGVGTWIAANNKAWVKDQLRESTVPTPTGETHHVTAVDDITTTGRRIMRNYMDGNYGHQGIVIKPADSTGARGVTILPKPDGDAVRLALLAAAKLSTQIIVEQYIPGPKYRVLVLDGAAIAITRTHPKEGSTIASVWGAGATRIEAWNELTETERYIAEDAAQAIPGLRVAGIDMIIHETTGDPYVLEVNATPRIWGHHHPDQGKPVDVAAQIIRAYLG